MHFVREKVKERRIDVVKIQTNINPADISPKGVTNTDHYVKQRNNQKTTIDHPLKNVIDQQKEQKGQQEREVIETSSKKTDEKAKDQNNEDGNEKV